MAYPTTPHTETQQNTKEARPDLKPDRREQAEGRQSGGDFERVHEGEQAGTGCAAENFSIPTGNAKTAPADVAYEGGLSTRAPAGETQGITAYSSDEESSRQQKVVKERPDAQAGTDHSR